MASLVGIAGYELHRLFPSKPEGALQLQAHAHVFVLDPAKLFLGDFFGLTRFCNVASVRYAVVLVGAGHDVLLVDLFSPPSQCRHAILDGPDGEVFGLPVADQGLNVLGF